MSIIGAVEILYSKNSTLKTKKNYITDFQTMADQSPRHDPGEPESGSRDLQPQPQPAASQKAQADVVPERPKSSKTTLDLHNF